jgi:hypothetical protein
MNIYLKNKPNKYLEIAVLELLSKHLDNKVNGTVTDDPELEKLKDHLLFKILDKVRKD